MSGSSVLPAEPPQAEGVLAPALLTGAVLFFVHLVAGAMLSAVAVTFSPGPQTAGGIWDVLVWGAAVATAVAAVRPVLRRTRRPLAVGLLAGLVCAAGYAGLALGVVGADATVPWLAARLASLVLAGLLAGLLMLRWPGGGTQEPEMIEAP